MMLTGVVLLFVIVMGAYLGLLDAVFSEAHQQDLVSKDPMFRWYAVNTYSGHENKVKQNLEHRVVSLNQAAQRAPDRDPHRAGVRR